MKLFRVSLLCSMAIMLCMGACSKDTITQPSEVHGPDEIAHIIPPPPPDSAQAPYAHNLPVPFVQENEQTEGLEKTALGPLPEPWTVYLRNFPKGTARNIEVTRPTPWSKPAPEFLITGYPSVAPGPYGILGYFDMTITAYNVSTRSRIGFLVKNRNKHIGGNRHFYYQVWRWTGSRWVYSFAETGIVNGDRGTAKSYYPSHQNSWYFVRVNGWVDAPGHRKWENMSVMFYFYPKEV